jgi:hypothetical protein
MDEAHTHHGAHLVRVLVATGFLALGWFVVGTIIGAAPASATTHDLIGGDETPDGNGIVSSVATIVDDPVRTAVAPVAEPTSKVTHHASRAVKAVTHAVEPVADPVVEAAIEPVIEPVIDPVIAATPVSELVDGASTVIDDLGLTDVVTDVTDAVPLPDSVPLTDSVTIAQRGSTVQTALNRDHTSAARQTSPAAHPVSPKSHDNAPGVPMRPTGGDDQSIVGAGFCGAAREAVLSGWRMPLLPTVGDVAAENRRVPAAPTFDFDTTPD